MTIFKRGTDRDTPPVGNNGPDAPPKRGPTLLEIVKYSEQGLDHRAVEGLAFTRWRVQSGRLTDDVDGGVP